MRKLSYGIRVFIIKQINLNNRRNGSDSGDEGTRTPDFLLAKEALSQLSYIP